MGYGTMGRSIASFAGAVLASAGAASVAPAQDYGMDWATIGDPGNRDTRPDEVPQWSDLEVGGVDYEYRIMRTELTVQDHFEYVQAYWPYVPENRRSDRRFTGRWITMSGTPQNPEYHIVDGAESRPTGMSWRHAARIANWLHNGKITERWAFEDGAYDTSTFGYNDDGTFTDQLEHHPDARFWIPTMDEHAKAVFWDPGKNDGDGGYWMFPHSKDVPPISGAPWEGGETNAGARPEDFPPLDVGSYPWATSPWGLLDGSGGQREWIETAVNGPIDRVFKGTMEYDSFHEQFDRLDHWWATGPDGGSWGIRFAASVPSPSSAILFASASVLANARRRRRTSGRWD